MGLIILKLRINREGYLNCDLELRNSLIIKVFTQKAGKEITKVNVKGSI